MNSLLGQFLVAAPHQLDPNFAKVVILVGGHAQRAAFGLVLNVSAGERRYCFEEHGVKRRCPSKSRLFFGGPVTGPLMAIHTQTWAGERQLLPGLFFSRKEKNVLALVWRAVQPCKIITGYAGWGPGQLDYEVEQGVWRVMPATPELVFSAENDMWERLSSQASRLQLSRVFNVSYVPANPLLN
jgi:putative transcriptional regulator